MNYNDLGVDFKYLVESDRDKKFGVSVNTVGFQSIQPHTPYPLSEHPSGYYFNTRKGRILSEYQFVYITKGKGMISFIPGEQIELNKGRVFIIYPGQWHTYYPQLETGWNEYYIGFEGHLVDEIVKNGFLSKENQIFEIGFNEELVKLFSRAIEVAEAEKAATQLYLGGILMHIMGLVLSASQNQLYEVNEVTQKIEQAKIIMNENIYKNIEPELLAEKLNISYSWFRKVFKDYTGLAPAKYFQELKLRKAKELLVSTSHSVKEIAYQLDYNSTEHFFSLFKKITAFTPLEYRAFARGTDKVSE
jgi:AraC-like DNA-binding protein